MRTERCEIGSCHATKRRIVEVTTLPLLLALGCELKVSLPKHAITEASSLRSHSYAASSQTLLIFVPNHPTDPPHTLLRLNIFSGKSGIVSGAAESTFT